MLGKDESPEDGYLRTLAADAAHEKTDPAAGDPPSPATGLIAAFCERIDQLNPGDEVMFELPAELAARLARVSTSACNAWAERDPMLGNGRDTRAVYAMTLGMVTAAGIMLDVIGKQTAKG
jgi:hypothetical protein